MTKTGTKAIPLQEFVDSGGVAVRVDRQGHVLRGVKLLGLVSRNGRRYREAALREAKHLYEGAKVNVDHPKGDPLGPRDYRDRLGVLRDVRLEAGSGLFASLHFNPKHPLAEQLVWDAEHSPDNVGLSHNVLARTSHDSEGVVVEAIDRVQSVDLVADPATTSGLFEQVNRAAADNDAGEAEQPRWDALTLEQLSLHRPDLFAEIAGENRKQLDEQERRIAELQAERAGSERRELIRQLLVEHGLPLPQQEHIAGERITSTTFVRSLEEAADNEAVRQLVVDRAAAIREARRVNEGPRSREQQPVGEADAVVSTADFVAAVTQR